MAVWSFVLVLFWATVVGGLTDEDVILVNETGLDIARVLIDERNLHEMKPGDKILVSVTPRSHDLKLVFRGGGDIDWPHFDFRGVHEMWFERGNHGNHFKVRVQ